MIDIKIDDNDILKLLNLYKQENSELKSQNEALRNEIADLKRQLAKNPPNNEQSAVKQTDYDKINLSNQKMNEAGDLFHKKNYESAIKLYNESIELNPNNIFAYNNRGRSYRALNQYELAIQDFNKAIQLNPNDALAYFNRGCAYDNLGKYEQAVQDYSKAVQLNPNSPGAYINRGNIYKNWGKYGSAIQDYDKAIQINPNYSSAYKNREECITAMR